MLNWIIQLQLLLAAISALLPFAPERYRARIGEVLEIIAHALATGGSLANNAGDLAGKLAAIRAEVEAMAARAVTTEELDAAMARVRAASASFRAALAEAEAQTV